MIVSPTLSDAIYASVRQSILLGRLKEGAPIRQDALASQLGVSKIPLREALAMLQRDGLVDLNPRRGYEVRTLRAKEAEEVFDLRFRIEPAAAARGALHADAEARSAAGEAHEALDRAIANGDPAAPDLNRAFHLALVRPGAGDLTLQLIERLHVIGERYVRAHLAPEGRGPRARREHADLLDAWLAGDAPKVEAEVGAHIAGALRDLRRQFAG